MQPLQSGLYVCVCVYECVCVCVCMYVCMYVCMLECKSECDDYILGETKRTDSREQQGPIQPLIEVRYRL